MKLFGFTLSYLAYGLGGPFGPNLLVLLQTSVECCRATPTQSCSESCSPLAQEMASFSNAGFGAEPEEQAGLMGKASELAKGLRHPMPALFHVLFKVRHALQARTHTPRQLTQSP